MNSELDIPWILMRRQLVSFREIQCWMKCRPMLDVWQLECCQALTLFGQSNNAVCESSTVV